MYEKLFDDASVMEDVNDLDESFGYYRPVMDDEEAQAADSDEPKRKRGRPPKDPSAAMTAAQKAERRVQLVESFERVKARRQS